MWNNARATVSITSAPEITPPSTSMSLCQSRRRTTSSLLRGMRMRLRSRCTNSREGDTGLSIPASRASIASNCLSSVELTIFVVIRSQFFCTTANLLLINVC
jgi:hypothetical protein